jgi:hypothetical protein
MLHSLKRSLVALAVASLVPALVHATTFDGKPKILLHLTHPTTKGILCDRGQIDDCQNAVVNGDLYPNGKSYFLFVEVAKGSVMNSVAGLQLSIDYDRVAGSGVDVFLWIYCAQAHYEAAGIYGAWPAPLSNNLITWNTVDNCQRVEAAIAGYFYLAAYSPDTFRVLPRIVGGNVSQVADCDAVVQTLSTADLGRVAFSSGAVTPGCNPCVEDCTTQTPRGNPIQPESVPVQASTWGAIKALYGTTAM